MIILIQSMGIKQKICYADTDSFITHIITEDFFKYIVNGVKKWFDTSNCNKKRPLPIGKNKKLPGLFKDELGRKTIIEVFAIRPKTYAYLIDRT